MNESEDRQRQGTPGRSLLSGAAIALVVLGLTACRDDAHHTVPRLVLESARLQGCGTVAVHDSGFLLNVVIPAACAPPPGAYLELEISEGGRRWQAVLRTAEPGTESEAALPGLGQRQITVLRAGSWRRFEVTDAWRPRDGAGLLVKDGALFLLGGWEHGPRSSAVWRSINLQDWQFLGDAPWTPRHGAGWAVHQGRLIVAGGDSSDDVWSSADGVQWVEEVADAPFIRRYTPNLVSLGDGLLLFGGQYWTLDGVCEPDRGDCPEEALRNLLPHQADGSRLQCAAAYPGCRAVGLADVWRSADGGRTWTRLPDHGAWLGRGLIHGAAVQDGRAYLIGGGLKATALDADYAETVAESSDIWSSSDGAAWTQHATVLPFRPRTHFSVLGTPAGCFVSDGSVGTQLDIVNELWQAADCVAFRPIPAPPLQPRHASSLAWFNGTLVILGGPPAGAAGTTVWQYVP